MAVITIPSTAHFEAVEVFKLQRAGVTLRSRYNGRRQAVTFPFALWVLEGTLLPKVGADAGLWRSFLVQLEGQKNTFKLPVPGWAGPLSGYRGGDPDVAGPQPAGSSSIAMTGLPATTPVILEGDYFTVNDELKVATGSFSTNAGGFVTVTFKPALRRPATAGLRVHLQEPYMVMQDQEDGTGWGLSRPVQHGIKLKLMEAFD